jgi:hypothetical protein
MSWIKGRDGYLALMNQLIYDYYCHAALAVNSSGNH